MRVTFDPSVEDLAGGGAHGASAAIISQSVAARHENSPGMEVFFPAPTAEEAEVVKSLITLILILFYPTILS